MTEKIEEEDHNQTGDPSANNFSSSQGLLASGASPQKNAVTPLTMMQA